MPERVKEPWFIRQQLIHQNLNIKTTKWNQLSTCLFDIIESTNTDCLVEIRCPSLYNRVGDPLTQTWNPSSWIRPILLCNVETLHFPHNLINTNPNLLHIAIAKTAHFKLICAWHCAPNPNSSILWAWCIWLSTWRKPHTMDRPMVAFVAFCKTTIQYIRSMWVNRVVTYFLKSRRFQCMNKHVHKPPG